MKKMLTKDSKQKNDYSLYFLICPYKNIVRYVGISRFPKKRLKGHLRESKKLENPYKWNWLKKIDKLGYDGPILKVVMTDLSFDEAFAYEIGFIRMLKAADPKNLTNIAVSAFPPFGGKKIYKCNLEGEPIREYNSMREAARENNLDNSSISKVVRGDRKTHGGFIWKEA